MGFVGVYSAIYDYQPQGQGELELREGDLLYVLEKSAEDDWWKAKKKADRDDEDEPEGLVPNNYVEEVRLDCDATTPLSPLPLILEQQSSLLGRSSDPSRDDSQRPMRAPLDFCSILLLAESFRLADAASRNAQAQPIHTAKALYDYTRQTDEEVSFSEDAELLVYDTEDPDWTLVGVNSDYGFAPANYIQIVDQPAASVRSPPSPEPAPPSLPQRPAAPPADESPALAASPAIDSAQNPAAAAIADIIHKQHAVDSEPPRSAPPPPQPSYEPEDNYREPSPPPPMLPQRPPSEQISSPVIREPPPQPSPPARTHVSAVQGGDQEHVKESPPYPRFGQPAPRSPSGYHMYNINEMVEVMGKRKKMPTTLGINAATGTIFISPEDDGDLQEWTADKLTHYAVEGKHVFVDLVRPSKSVDFHAGAKDTAREIVSALGEIAGIYRAEGLKEVVAAGVGGAQKTGQILYEFMAQGDDEVTVAVGDEVIILDETKSDEWWMVRRLKNGKEGVVPSSYIEITGTVPKAPAGIESGLSTVEKNRLEESRLAKEALRKSKTEDSLESTSPEVGHSFFFFAPIQQPRTR